MRKRLLLIGLVVLLAVPLALILRDFAREMVVMPFLYTIWLGRLVIQSIPQSLIWALFCMLAMLITLRSLAGRERPLQQAPGVEMGYPGQVRTWARRIYLAARGDYSGWRLAQYLERLILEVLAYRERLSTDQVKRRLALPGEELDVPPEVQAYLQTRPMPPSSGPVGPFPLSKLLYRLRLHAKPSSLDADLERVIEFLEGQLEVGRDSRDR